MRIYPADYRLAFEVEMQAAFDRSAKEHRDRGRLPYLRFLMKELAGLGTGAIREWIAKSRTSRSVRARTLPDLGNMRPAGVPGELWFATPRRSVPDEIAAARQRVEFCLRRMEHAIANHDFPGARYYSDEDLKAREQLRQLREKQGLAE